MTSTDEEQIRALTRKMKIAFEGKRQTLFQQLAGERLRILKRIDPDAAPSDEFRKLLRELAQQDQAWLDAARQKANILRVEIDRLRGRKSALRRISQAYNKTPPSAQFFSRRG
jgi:hypothetical protein